MLWAGLFSNAHADNALHLVDGKESYSLGFHLSYLEDKRGTLTLEDVMHEPSSRDFSASGTATPNFGFTDSVYWFRLDLHNQSSNVATWLLESQYPLLDRLDLFLVYLDGRIISRASGDTLPFSQRAIKHRHVMFNIPLAQGEHVDAYIRVKTESSVQVPLTLWSTKALLAKDHEEQYVLGIYYGILIAMFLYNLLIYLSIRDANYLYYLHYLSGWILMQMSLNGLAFEYLWPKYPQWGNIAMPFFLGIVGTGIVQFTRAFLQLKKNLPVMDWICRIYLVLWTVVIVGVFFLPYPVVMKLGTLNALTASIAVVISGAWCLKRRIRQAKYFMIAWSLLLFAILVYTLKTFGLMPSNFFTEYGVQIGSSLEVTLLSFALAHRMRILKEENERIQHEATETLEVRVRQRTEELGQALQNLSDASEKLKDVSRIDGLTGVKNRNYFNEKLDAEWQRALRNGKMIGLLMVDIDHFKQINDTYGHLGGDVCLKQVADALRQAIRRSADDLFRYGGEEFAVMLPETDLLGTTLLGETIRGSIEAAEVMLNGQRISVTVSVGTACMTPQASKSSDLLISAADSALYEAKRNGRNQVRIHGACSSDVKSPHHPSYDPTA